MEEIKKTFHTELTKICERLDLRPTYITSLSEYMEMAFDIYIAGFRVHNKSFVLQARLEENQIVYYIMIICDFKTKKGVRKIIYQDVKSNKNLNLLLIAFQKDYNVYYKLENKR